MLVRALRLHFAVAVGFLLVSPARAQSPPTQAQLTQAHANPNDWLHANGDYGGQRYADLKQINRENVHSLRPVCLYQPGDTAPFRPYPTVHAGSLYLATTHAVIALDAATCRVRWRHDRALKAEGGWPLGGGGVALKDGRVIWGTRDGYLVALDMNTGELLWERRVAIAEIGEGFTMPLVVYEDLIIAGPAGSEKAVQGWVGAFRLSDGEPVWRFHTMPRAGEPGAETWGSAGAVIGGGAVWTPFSLEPEQGWAYVPVGNPAPDLYGDSRPGENWYTGSMIALDVRSGALQWHYPVVRHDTHDWDLTQVSPLFTIRIDGRDRRAVAVVGKDGVLHVLDRESRKPLYTVPVTRRRNVEAAVTVEGIHVCPGLTGGVEWNGPAFNPGTGMLYVPAVDWCGTYRRAPDTPSPDEAGWHFGGTYRSDPPEEAAGWLTAVEAASGSVRWRYHSSKPLVAGVTTTSTALVFTGELTGDLIVLDATDGRVLHRFNTGGPINGGVITYAVGGKQYVAVTSGRVPGFWHVPVTSGLVAVFALP